MFATVNERLAAGLHIGRVPLPNRYRDGCGGALIHRVGGRKSSPCLQGVRDNALELVRRHYHDFGPNPVYGSSMGTADKRLSLPTAKMRLSHDGNRGLLSPKGMHRVMAMPKLRREFSEEQLVNFY